MKCFGCQRPLDIGDRYIQDTASGFLRKPASGADGVIADLYGSRDGKVAFCADCTEPGGNYMFETFYGDEDEGG